MSCSGRKRWYTVVAHGSTAFCRYHTVSLARYGENCLSLGTLSLSTAVVGSDTVVLVLLSAAVRWYWCYYRQRYGIFWCYCWRRHVQHWCCCRHRSYRNTGGISGSGSSGAICRQRAVALLLLTAASGSCAAAGGSGVAPLLPVYSRNAAFVGGGAVTLLSSTAATLLLSSAAATLALLLPAAVWGMVTLPVRSDGAFFVGGNTAVVGSSNAAYALSATLTEYVGVGLASSSLISPLSLDSPFPLLYL